MNTNRSNQETPAIQRTPALGARERVHYDAEYAHPAAPGPQPEAGWSVRELFAFDRLHMQPGVRILELGCGAGQHAVELAQRGGWIVGVDVALNGLRRARDLAQARHEDEHLALVVMDGHALGCASGSIDRVFGAQVLHHVDCAIVGAEVGRVLKPGGRAVFIENSDRNPLLRVARRYLVGRLGVRRYGSDEEAPLQDTEIEAFCRASGTRVQVHMPQLCLTVLLARHWLRFPWAMRLFLATDRLLDRYVPPLRRWSFLQVLEFSKDDGIVVES